jgi:hypothetical protein
VGVLQERVSLLTPFLFFGQTANTFFHSFNEGMRKDKARIREIETQDRYRQKMSRAKVRAPPRAKSDTTPRQRVAVKRLQELQKKWAKQTEDDPAMPSQSNLV